MMRGGLVVLFVGSRRMLVPESELRWTVQENILVLEIRRFPDKWLWSMKLCHRLLLHVISCTPL